MNRGYLCSLRGAESYGSGHKKTWPRGYKHFFMPNSTEHEIYPAHKC